MQPCAKLCVAPEAARSMPTWVAGSSSSGLRGRDNIRRDELKAFRLLAEEMLGMDDAGLRAALSNGTIMEVACDG